MKESHIETLEYIVEYTDLLDDTAQEIAEKILFDGNLEELDALERDVYNNSLKPLLSPDCEGTEQQGCCNNGKVEPENALAGYQSGNFICKECEEISELRKAG